LKPTRQQRLARAKFALPSFVTLLSIACGFGSIVISVDNAPVGDPADYRLAAILLVLAGVFDALDGFVARATNTQSDFGVQLDSIADVMNFGCAPACCCTATASPRWRRPPDPGAHGRPGLLRVRRLRRAAPGALQRDGRATDPRYFVGMPITAGAACVASVVVAWPDPVASMGRRLPGDAADGGGGHADGVDDPLPQLQAAEIKGVFVILGVGRAAAGAAADALLCAVLRVVYQRDAAAEHRVAGWVDLAPQGLRRRSSR
jgi:phosphatidylserine synthase